MLERAITTCLSAALPERWIIQQPLSLSGEVRSVADRNQKTRLLGCDQLTVRRNICGYDRNARRHGFQDCV